MASTSAPAVPISNHTDGIKVGAFVATMIMTLLAICTAWATLSARIERTATKIENTEKRVDNIDVKLDKIFDKVSDIDVKMERKQDKK
jgi:peptidoglycan hydrolase CwlO-like protein